MSQIVSLWKRYRSGAAFEECVRAHMARLYNLAWRLTRSPEDAEDLLQETLLRAHKRREQLLGMESPGAWLAQVLHNAWVDRWRRQGVMREADSLDGISERAGTEMSISDTGIHDAVDAETVMKAIAGLPVGQQPVVLLHDVAGYTLEEIGDALGIPVGTCKSRLHRARAALRIALAEGTFCDIAAFTNSGR